LLLHSAAQCPLFIIRSSGRLRELISS
jgi:hypothetical protein